METDLRRAIERHEFRLYYQPLVRLDGHALVGFEALLRWQHPELGLLLPEAIIPLAEETGLIVPLGRWVLREACRQLAAWRDQGCPVGDLWIHVNLSSREFQQADLVDYVRTALSDYSLDGRQLAIEITESTEHLEQQENAVRPEVPPRSRVPVLAADRRPRAAYAADRHRLRRTDTCVRR